MRQGAFSFIRVFHVHACSKRRWMQATSSNLGRERRGRHGQSCSLRETDVTCRLSRQIKNSRCRACRPVAESKVIDARRAVAVKSVLFVSTARSRRASIGGGPSCRGGAGWDVNIFRASTRRRGVCVIQKNQAPPSPLSCQSFFNASSSNSPPYPLASF
ncbi:hypothetical protein BKA81DRAFT_24493 [Phyllosticta paracitricarpa]